MLVYINPYNPRERSHSIFSNNLQFSSLVYFQFLVYGLLSTFDLVEQGEVFSWDYVSISSSLLLLQFDVIILLSIKNRIAWFSFYLDHLVIISIYPSLGLDCIVVQDFYPFEAHMIYKRPMLLVFHKENWYTS